MSQPSIPLRPPVTVGKYFLERGKISEQQLDLALKHREEFGLKLGQSLVELGFVTEADMVEALRHQARFPCIRLTPGIVDARIAHKVGPVESRRLKIVALNQIAGHTTVAIEDPTDLEALQALSHILATRIFAVHAPPSSIQKMIEHVFGPDRSSARPAPGPKHPEPKPSSTGIAPRPVLAEPRKEAPGAPAAAPASANPNEPPPEERAVVDRLRGFLHEAFTQGVSDLHMEALADGLLVRFRREGALAEHARLPRSWARPALACLKALAKIEGTDAAAPGEGSIPFLFNKRHVEVCVSITPSRHGESAVLHVRHGEEEARSFSSLGLTAEHVRALEEPIASGQGLVLVAGPAGSGRTTTLHALLERHVAPARKLVELSQRKNAELAGVLQIQLERRNGLGGELALRTLDGQDPDVFALDEVDSPGLAQALLEGTARGRCVLATIRAGGALEALGRLIAFGLEPYLLADALRAVIAQRLVRSICPTCRTPIVPDEALSARLDLADDTNAYYEGQGCPACHGTGYRARFGLFEVLSVTPGLRRTIEKGEDREALLAVASADGFRALRQHGLERARTGLTTLHEVLSATTRR